MLWAILGTLAAAAAVIFLWLRRRRRPRIISFVALLREPAHLEPAILARVAGKVWNADLGDGSAEGADGMAVGIGELNTIFYAGRITLVNSFAAPYVSDREAVAKGMVDLRMQTLFREHEAWFSCDALGINRATPEAEVDAAYRRLAPLFAELLDANCLLIYLPDRARAYPINDDTEAALRSDDPLKALQETLTMPIIEVKDDDPAMVQAVEEARRTWPDFAAAYEAKAGENFAAKAPITYEEKTEFIWATITCIEGERVYGELGNEPGDLGPLKLGSKVSFALADLNDWMYVDPKGQLLGGFTIKVLQSAAEKKAKG